VLIAEAKLYRNRKDNDIKRVKQPFLYTIAYRKSAKKSIVCKLVSLLFGLVARLGKDRTSRFSAPDRHVFWTSSWSHMETFSKSLKKQVSGSYSLWQQPPTRWSVEMCYPLRSFWGNTMVQADCATTTIFTDLLWIRKGPTNKHLATVHWSILYPMLPGDGKD